MSVLMKMRKYHISMLLDITRVDKKGSGVRSKKSTLVESYLLAIASLLTFDGFEAKVFWYLYRDLSL